MKARVILFKPGGKFYCEEEWTIPEGEVIPISNSSRKRNVIGPYDMEFSPDFRRIEGGAVLIETQEPWGYPHLFPGRSIFAPTVKAEEVINQINFTDIDPPTVGVSGFDIYEASNFYSKNGKWCKCSHLLIAHVDDSNECAECSCVQFTTAEQSSSYCKSEQSEHSFPCPEPQPFDRFQCKFQRGHIVEVLLARRGSTLRLSHPEEPDLNWGQLFRILPALMTCEEVECRDDRILVERVLNSLLLALESCRPKHKEHYSSPPVQQVPQLAIPENSDLPRRVKQSPAHRTHRKNQIPGPDPT